MDSGLALACVYDCRDVILNTAELFMMWKNDMGFSAIAKID